MGGGKSGTGNQGGPGNADSRGTTAETNPGLRFATPGPDGINGFATGASESDLLRAVDGGDYAISERLSSQFGTTYQLGVEVADASGNRSYSYYDQARIFVPSDGGPITMDYRSATGETILTSKFKTLDGAKKAGKRRLKASISAHYNEWRDTGYY